MFVFKQLFAVFLSVLFHFSLKKFEILNHESPMLNVYISTSISVALGQNAEHWYPGIPNQGVYVIGLISVDTLSSAHLKIL
jgi:hypothetical protein